MFWLLLMSYIGNLLGLSFIWNLFRIYYWVLSYITAW